jgi:hypothetical protein
MSESFDWHTRIETREHEELVADVMRQHEEARALARSDAERDVDALLSKILPGRLPVAEKPKYSIDFSEIRDDLLGHVGIRALVDRVKRK